MVECPMCKGDGKIPDAYKLIVDTVEIKKEMALKLKAKGYSYRQIQKALGYKSVRSVSHLLKSETN
jgi:hypothetical protein